MAKENPKLEPIKMRQVKPKKTLGLTIRPALQLPLPHDDLIKSSDIVDIANNLKVQDVEVDNHSTQQKPTTTPLDQSDQLTNRPVQNLDRSKLDRSKFCTGLEIRPEQEKSSQEIKAGYLKLPHEMLDNVFPKLSPTEVVIFLRLYRLSIGFNSDLCTVGITSLIKACNISEQTCRTSLRRLIDLKLIKQIEVVNTKEIKGTTYQILTPLEIRPVQNLDRSNNATGLNSRPNKDHDHDDSLNKDHHQMEVMMIYQTLTGNSSWTKSDKTAYEKIKHLSLKEVTTLIKSTLEKAHQKPASLAYFVKAYQTPTQANPANREANKRKIEAIMKRVRESHVGSTYTISDLAFDVKAECAREGIVFDNNLFNELLEKKNR